MSSELGFDGRVVVVTGAGAGLGKSYALWFASRGAAVVVNDLGAASNGEGASGRPAELVVEEIKKKGGKAVADYNSVEQGEKIVQTAIDNFGRIDILINNAGILRDRTIVKTNDEDWDLIHRVHLRGPFVTTRAAWPYFRKQNYGRIIVTSSSAGIYGNFGQTNYSAAKMALVGMSNTLALEGAKYNIHCNVIVPTAASRLTKGMFPEEVAEQLNPDLIAPVVLWLCHESCEENGSIIDSAVGWVGKYRWEHSHGVIVRGGTDEGVLPEKVRDNWEEITDFKNSKAIKNGPEHSLELARVLQELQDKDALKKNVNLSPVEKALSWRPPSVKFTVTPNDVILYALSIGVSTADKGSLRYIYERDANFSAIPTYGVLMGQEALTQTNLFTGATPGWENIDLSKLLHGEQFIELHKPIPTSGNLVANMKIIDILDKKSGALFVVNVEVTDESDEKILTAQWAAFIVGAGNFGGRTSSESLVPLVPPPKREPDVSLQYKTSIDQSALYRLTGDFNPLHIDPDFAAMGGYDQPILHGLISYGVTCRHVIAHFAGNDPSQFKAMKVRFASPVLPGHILQMNMWREGNRIHVETKNVDTGKVVLAGGYIDLKSVTTAADVQSATPLPTNSSSGLQSEQVFAEIKRRLEAKPDVGEKINAVYQWNITVDKKPAASWIVDLKVKPGEIYVADEPRGKKADCTLTLEDADMVALVTGKLDAQKAYMQGKLKIKGNIMLTQKLQGLLKDQSKL